MIAVFIFSYQNKHFQSNGILCSENFRFQHYHKFIFFRKGLFIKRVSVNFFSSFFIVIIINNGQFYFLQQANQSSVTQKVEEEKRNNILLDHFGTDTDDDDFDDDDYISDSQQMIKEMKAEAAYQEKKLIDQKRQETEVGKSDFSLSSK